MEAQFHEAVRRGFMKPQTSLKIVTKKLAELQNGCLAEWSKSPFWCPSAASVSPPRPQQLCQTSQIKIKTN